MNDQGSNSQCDDLEEGLSWIEYTWNRDTPDKYESLSLVDFEDKVEDKEEPMDPWSGLEWLRFGDSQIRLEEQQKPDQISKVDTDTEDLSIEMEVTQQKKLPKKSKMNESNPKQVEPKEGNHRSLGETLNEVIPVFWRDRTFVDIPSQKPYLRI